MSYEFIRSGKNSQFLYEAQRQHKDLSYFTKSSIQENVSLKQVEAFLGREYESSDSFINFVKTVFKTDNFKQFYRYLRFPLPSAQLVNDKIVPELSRIFYADDSSFEYTLRGKAMPKPEFINEDFNDELFDAILFRHNSVVVIHKDNSSKPSRYIVDIDEVIAVETNGNKINKIAFNGSYDGESGVIYIDDKTYQFYKNKNETPEITATHLLGYCPVEWTVQKDFDESKSKVVKRSIFSYSREKMEEYVFLKTLQRMTEPNGVIPVVTILKANKPKNIDAKAEDIGGLMSASELLTGQKPTHKTQFPSDGKTLNTGTKFEIDVLLKGDGSFDMDAVKHFINFHHMPVDPLDYLNKRIQEIEQSIIRFSIGDYEEQNSEAKNELQVDKSYISRKDKLREVSDYESSIIERTEKVMLDLTYGIGKTTNKAYCGSDFFLESEADILTLIEKSPNPIETKNLLLRLAKIRNRFNPKKATREKILYSLLPYTESTAFDKADAKGIVDNFTFSLQTQFNYWVSKFEAKYGDIVEFWNAFGETSDAEKLIIISNLIKQEYDQSSSAA